MNSGVTVSPMRLINLRCAEFLVQNLERDPPIKTKNKQNKSPVGRPRESAWKDAMFFRWRLGREWRPGQNAERLLFANPTLWTLPHHNFKRTWAWILFNGVGCFPNEDLSAHDISLRTCEWGPRESVCHSVRTNSQFRVSKRGSEVDQSPWSSCFDAFQASI